MMRPEALIRPRNYLARMVSIGLVITVAMGLSSCTAFASPPSPTAQNIAGVWVNRSARIDLKADGTFTMTDVPRYTDFTTDQNWRNGDKPTRDGVAEWSIESDAVRLMVKNGNGEKLFFDSAGGERVLAFGLQLGSDDPRCFQFVKAGSTTDPLRPDDCFIRP